MPSDRHRNRPSPLQVFLTSLTYFILSMAHGANVAFPATYFVRADGTAPSKDATFGCQSPVQAISLESHNLSSFSPGDVIILCAEGGVFRATLFPPSSGTPEEPIRYDGRGTAVISGSDLVVGWYSNGNDVYSSDQPTEPKQVFIDGVFANRKDNVSELSADGDWCWVNGVLSLFASGGNPGFTHFAPGVEVGARQNGVFLNARDAISINGVTVRHANGRGVLVEGSSWFHIIDSIIEWNYLVGINLVASEFAEGNSLIENNISRFNGGGGISLGEKFENIVIRKNTVYGNGKFQGDRHFSQTWTGGIKLWGNRDFGSGAIVEENTVYENGNPGDLNYQGVGIWIDECIGSPDRNIIRHNYVHNNNGFGIYIEKSSRTDVGYNIVDKNGVAIYAAGIIVGSNEGALCAENMVSNNTITRSGYWGLACGVGDDFFGEPELVNNSFINNIIVDSGVSELVATNGCINDGIHGSGNTFQFNSLGIQYPGFIMWDWAYISTYGEWELLYGEETNSVEEDPEIFDPDSGKFWLTSGSSCVDSGLPLSSDRALGLREVSFWPTGVLLSNQNDHGAGWEIGAMCFTGAFDGLLFGDGFESGDFRFWMVSP